MKLARAAATLLAMAVLVACSDDPEPQIEPSESPSTPPSSSSPQPTEPRAEGVVRQWVDAQNEALKTGDTADLRRISDPSCETCTAGFLEPIESLYAAGGHFETEGWTVTAVKVRDETKATIEVDVGVNIAGGRTFADANADPVTYEAEKRIVLFRVRGPAVTFVGFVS